MFESYYTGTTCSDSSHEHTYSSDAFQIEEGVSMWFSPCSVKMQRSKDGRLVRLFAAISYTVPTGEMLVTIREGLTSMEFRSALATAMGPRQDPRNWPAHPCRAERRRISLYRYVDDNYVSEVAEEVFSDLGDAEDHFREVLEPQRGITVGTVAELQNVAEDGKAQS